VVIFYGEAASNTPIRRLAWFSSATSCPPALSTFLVVLFQSLTWATEGLALNCVLSEQFGL
jgi:hypothetical protein